MSNGERFRKAVADNAPLQIVGVINPYCALMAKKLHFQALYLSGAGVANYSLGLPDLGLTTLDEVCLEVDRITSCVDLPLLVDADTGWGGPLMVERSVKRLIKAGAAAIHIEDQKEGKRCGHRPNKQLVTTAEMVEKIEVAHQAKTDPAFVLIE